jgi:hypothetical protein
MGVARVGSRSSQVWPCLDAAQFALSELIEDHVSLIEYADDMGETLDLTVLGENPPKNLLVHSLADSTIVI